MMAEQDAAGTRSALKPRTRAEYEDFLFNEAALLDEWRLDEWLALFTTDSIYEVPTMGQGLETGPDNTLYYVADDYCRLQHRVKRLGKPSAHAEWPHSTHVRAVNNVRILGVEELGVHIACTFTTYRSKHHVTDTYIGHAHYWLVDEGGEIRINAKRVLLGMNSLQPHGKVSIIL